MIKHKAKVKGLEDPSKHSPTSICSLSCFQLWVMWGIFSFAWEVDNPYGCGTRSIAEFCSSPQRREGMMWPLWAGSPCIPKSFLGAVQGSFREEGSSGEAARAVTLSKCRKGGAWRRKEQCPELHHMGKRGGSVTPGAELKHVLRNLCSCTSLSREHRA